MISAGGVMGSVASAALDDRLGVDGTAGLVFATCLTLDFFVEVGAVEEASGEDFGSDGELLTLDLCEAISDKIKLKMRFTCVMSFEEKTLLAARDVVARVRDELQSDLHI
jgi:hypothetical protein